ncbi:DMT family transporter [Paenibacillus sp. M1]|uniref:DMT family transporter n=1 Tax=Paenibacillus haidiansis TaxID=1574488 RepID=A0ABU7VNS5_9BACL
MNRSLTPKATFGLVVFLVVVWGINWPLTKMALPEVPPILFSGIRTLLGGILLLMIAIRHRSGLRWKENKGVYLILALFNIIGYYGLQTVGIGYLPAGLFSTIVFLQPVLLGLFSWIWLGESMSWLKWVGLIIGFGGVALISLGGLQGHLSPVGIVLALLSALCWAIGSIYMKKKSAQLDSLWAVTVQMLIGGAFLTLAGSATESWGDIHWTASFIGLLLFISIFVIAAGWLVYFKLLDSGEASTVGSYTFAIPVLASIFSIFLLGESITLTLVLGLLLISFSIGLVNRKTAPKSLPASAEKQPCQQG